MVRGKGSGFRGSGLGISGVISGYTSMSGQRYRASGSRMLALEILGFVL